MAAALFSHPNCDGITNLVRELYTFGIEGATQSVRIEIPDRNNTVVTVGRNFFSQVARNSYVLQEGDEPVDPLCHQAIYNMSLTQAIEYLDTADGYIRGSLVSFLAAKIDKSTCCTILAAALKVKNSDLQSRCFCYLSNYLFTYSPAERRELRLFAEENNLPSILLHLRCLELCDPVFHHSIRAFDAKCIRIYLIHAMDQAKQNKLTAFMEEMAIEGIGVSVQIVHDCSRYLSFITRSSSLKSLYITKINRNIANLTALFSNCPSLESIGISDTYLTPEFIATIRRLQYLKEIIVYSRALVFN